jgi:hypothetical protein
MTQTRIHILPDVRRHRITVQIDAPDDATVRLVVDGQDVEYTGPAGTVKLDVPNCTEWSVDHPTLYTLSCTVDGDDTSVSPVIPFALRELTIKDTRFYFNTRPLLVKAVQHDVIPDAPADKQAPFIKQELTFARDMGFNAVEFVSVFPQAAYDEADRLGLLIIQHLPADWDDALLRSLWNHPSVAVWELGATTENRAKELQQRDPGRLIFFAGESGSRHIKPFRSDAAPLDRLHTFQRAPLDTYSQLYLSHLGEPDRPSWAYTCGYRNPYPTLAAGSESADSLQKDLKDRDLSTTFADPETLSKECVQFQAASVQAQMDAVRNNPKLAGYSIRRLRDFSEEDGFGLLNTKYEPKPVAGAMKNANQQMRPLIQMQQHNLTVRQSTQVTVNLANELKLEGRAELSLQVVGPTNQVLWKKKRNVKIPKHGKLLWGGSVAASGSPGVHKFVVRVLKDMKRIAENSVEFFVYPAVSPWSGTVNVLDPAGIWKDRYGPLVGDTSLLAPLQIIPPLANTIRAYPDNDLAQILGQVHEGATGLFFAPPEDWNDLARIVDESLLTNPVPAISAESGVVHYAKLHPIFESLPTRSLMGSSYSSVMPSITYLDASDEEMAGSIQRNAESSNSSLLWGNDILVRRYGNGRLVFTHLNLFEHLGSDMVADYLFTNMLRHFARRSLAARGTLAVHQRSVEWLRNERRNHTHKWMVLGMFPDWDHGGMDTAYPPETSLDFDATYPGWYRALTWQPWFTTSHEKHAIAFTDALAPVAYESPNADSGIAYAYAEITCEARCEVSLILDTKCPVKIFVNGAIHGDSGTEPLPETLPLKQGRNTLLIKAAKFRGDCTVGIDLKPAEPAGTMTWWK